MIVSSTDPLCRSKLIIDETTDERVTEIILLDYREDFISECRAVNAMTLCRFGIWIKESRSNKRKNWNGVVASQLCRRYAPRFGAVRLGFRVHLRRPCHWHVSQASANMLYDWWHTSCTESQATILGWDFFGLCIFPWVQDRCPKTFRLSVHRREPFIGLISDLHECCKAKRSTAGSAYSRIYVRFQSSRILHWRLWTFPLSQAWRRTNVSITAHAHTPLPSNELSQTRRK